MKKQLTPNPPDETPTAKGVDLAKRLTLFKGMDPSLFAGMVMYGAPGVATHLAGKPVPETPPKSEQN